MDRWINEWKERSEIDERDTGKGIMETDDREREKR